jgi:hypothetical protein
MRLLDYLCHLRGTRNLWIALPGEVNRWWRERQNLRPVWNGRSWTVEGQGSARAVVAWARLVQDRIVYSFAEPSLGVPAFQPDEPRVRNRPDDGGLHGRRPAQVTHIH